MAHRPIKDKQLARLRKAVRPSPTRYIDLVQWLRDHGHAQTAGEARRIILAERVRYGSHRVGFVKELDANGDEVNVLAPVDAKLRADLIVVGE